MLPRALAATLILFAVITLTSAVRYGAPNARGKDAPADVFSGERARAVLGDVLGDGAPHPTGSEANVRVRSRIVAELTRLGYLPEVQDSFACGKYGSCAFLSNVVARLEGTEKGPTVLVAAHYDSVFAGAGANDDGSGVSCVLEIARALKAGPPMKHGVVLVLTDAEEAGLNGAEAFARDHEAMRDVRAAVNLDARGSSGPSMMFETSPNNAWIIDLAASVLPRPVTSSLYYAVYQRMPNDTDFTIWKRTSHGANFAFTGSIEHYHTPLDRLENARAGVLQHQGENALAMVRAFASADIGSPPPGDAVWFDVLALFVAHWSERVNMGIAAIALAVCLLSLRRSARDASAYDIVVGFLTMPVTIAVSAFAAMLVALPLSAAGVVPAPWVANATPLLCAMYLGAICAAVLLAIQAMRIVRSPEALRVGVGLSWSVAGVAIAWTVPGASYLFVIPALAAGLAALARPRGPMSAATLSVAAAGVWIPVLWLLYPGVGLVAPAVHGAALGVLLTTLVPLFPGVSARARGPLAGVTGISTVVLAVFTVFRAPFSAAVPSRANVIFQVDASAKKARTIVDPTWGALTWGPVPEPMRVALGPSAHLDRRFEWSALEVLATDATALAAPALTPAPELTPTSSGARPGGRTIHARLRSPRGARTIVIAFPPQADARIVRAHGIPMTVARPMGSSGWTYATFFATPPEGIELELTVGAAPTELTVLDQTPGVPPSAAPVVAARPLSNVPTQDGDVTVVTTTVRL